MKTMHFAGVMWLYTRRTTPLTVIVLLSIVDPLAAQESADTQETEAQRIYRQAYEAAIANSPGSTWPCNRPWWGEPSCQHSASRPGGRHGQGKGE